MHNNIIHRAEEDEEGKNVEPGSYPRIGDDKEARQK